MKLNIFLLSLVALVSCKNEASNTEQSALNETNLIETEVKKSLSEVSSKASILSEEIVGEKEIPKEISTESEVMIKTTEPIKAVVNKSKENVTEVSTTITNTKLNTTVKETSTPVTITESKTKLDEANKLVSNAESKIKEEKPSINKLETKSIAPISNATWNTLLKKHVDSKGNVSYANFKKDEKILQSYLDFMAKNKPSQSTPKNEQLAYYINLYNASTVKLILNNYPVKSIKDIKGPWDQKWVKVGNETLSLGHIEHKILRKMNEPRIHFAINCASYSCPKLFNKMFTATNMEQMLEQASKDFVNDTSRNKFTEKAKLSKIFKWYKGDFTANGGSVLEYIAKYSSKEINTKSKIEYLDYDWSLNKKK